MAAMTRGTALVPDVATVVQLTGVQDLAHLEVDGELTLTDLLTTASDAIYDQLEADGVDPTLLANANRFERAVAWHFLALLAIGNYLPPPPGATSPQNENGQADAYAWSDPYYRRVRAELTTGAEARRPNESLPSVVNIDQRPFFDSSNSTAGEAWNDLPRIR